MLCAEGRTMSLAPWSTYDDAASPQKKDPITASPSDGFLHVPTAEDNVDLREPNSPRRPSVYGINEGYYPWQLISYLVSTIRAATPTTMRTAHILYYTGRRHFCQYTTALDNSPLSDAAYAASEAAHYVVAPWSHHDQGSIRGKPVHHCLCFLNIRG